jgi:hypothetical protein
MGLSPCSKALKKRPRVPRKFPPACLACGSEAGYRAETVTREVGFRGEVVTVTYERMACPACGSATLTDEQMAARWQSVAQRSR